MSLAVLNQDADTEARLRVEIAACTRLMNMEGVIGYSGHVSARLLGDRFLVQDFDQSRASLTPEGLVVCDMNGRLLAGAMSLRPPAEVHIHSELYKARPDVNAIAHFHHDLTTIFTVVEGLSLVPLKNHAVRWRSGIPVHPDPSHVDSPELGRGLAATLGPHHACLIRAHGEIVVAEDVRSLLIDCIHFVENGVALYQAAALGKVLPLTRREMDDFERSFKRDKHVAKLWTYYVGRGREAGLLPEEWNRWL
jgi:ribulose-5-phosphate 4-epimerase/fuculose-1-phosphate aldolase